MNERDLIDAYAAFEYLALYFSTLKDDNYLADLCELERFKIEDHYGGEGKFQALAASYGIRFSIDFVRLGRELVFKEFHAV